MSGICFIETRIGNDNPVKLQAKKYEYSRTSGSSRYKRSATIETLWGLSLKKNRYRKASYLASSAVVVGAIFRKEASKRHAKEAEAQVGELSS